jgi:hypothetical protein
MKKCILKQNKRKGSTVHVQESAGKAKVLKDKTAESVSALTIHKQIPGL